MKKILFLQNKGKSLGGVWFVNKTLGEQFLKLGYDIEIASIRNNKVDINLEYNPKINVFTINENDLWEIPYKRDVLNSIRKLKFFRTVYKYVLEQRKMKKDYNTLSNYIKKSSPNYIIVSHYQLLETIPSEYLKSTIFVQHSSFDDVLKYKNCIKTVKKYNNLLGKICWLTKKTCEIAKKYGITNSTYIYNPIRIFSNKIADVDRNKTLVTISRIDADQKRIDLMIKIADKIFKDKKFSNWSLKIYGPGNLSDDLIKIVDRNPQIELMGKIDDISKALLSSSIYLSTSYMEGFSMSILEAYEFGIPVVAYNFGESCREQILDNETGNIIDLYDENKFIEKLTYLMNNPEILKRYSKNSKEYANNFNVQNIANQWIKLFKQVDDNKNV